MGLNKSNYNENKEIYLKALANKNNLKLSERANSILNLFFIDNRSSVEIGKTYGISRQRVWQLVIKYLQKLKYYNNKLEKTDK